jgi:hypothetical protein
MNGQETKASAKHTIVLIIALLLGLPAIIAAASGQIGSRNPRGLA